jgi:hypothetical protein
MVAVGITAEN